MTDSFDRLLREALEAPRPTRAGECLDAGRLAAWAEGTLDRTARAEVEAHAADCAMCQALLAAMVRTEVAVESRPWWRSPAFVWVAPLTVAALVAIVVWVDSPSTRPVQVSEMATQTKAEQPSSVLPPSPAAGPSTEAASSAAALPRSAAGNGERRALASPPAAARERSAPMAPPVPMADQSQAALAAAPPPPAAVVPPPAAEMPPPHAAAPSPVTVRTAPGAAAMARPTVSRQESAKAVTADVSARAQFEGQGLLLVETANRAARWRVTGPGWIERSIDGGLKWERQATGVNARVVAGTAPSATVCWMVGGRGVVLLSVDGRTWMRLPFPDDTLDLVAVTAADDRSATVTALTGKRFSTSDRGATWTAVPEF